MNRAIDAIVRVSAEIGGVFLILAATSEVFDATEIAVLVGIAAVLVTVEVVMWFARDRARRIGGGADVVVLAAICVLGLAFVRSPQPEFRLHSDTVAAIAALRTT